MFEQVHWRTWPVVPGALLQFVVTLGVGALLQRGDVELIPVLLLPALNPELVLPIGLPIRPFGALDAPRESEILSGVLFVVRLILVWQL